MGVKMSRLVLRKESRSWWVWYSFALGQRCAMYVMRRSEVKELKWRVARVISSIETWSFGAGLVATVPVPHLIRRQEAAR